jgi:hypothetical protein
MMSRKNSRHIRNGMDAVASVSCNNSKKNAGVHRLRLCCFIVFPTQSSGVGCVHIHFQR